MDFESGKDHVYNMFESVVDVVHGKKREKLKFVKCMQCGRYVQFRPKSKSMRFTAFYCNHCGGIISFGARGKGDQISEQAEIFCENCEDDCRKCQINKLANKQAFSRKHYIEEKSSKPS